MKQSLDQTGCNSTCGRVHVGRVVGWALVALAVVSVGLMALHPASGWHDGRRLGAFVYTNTLVHGSLITVSLLTAGFMLWLRDALGPDRLLVRLGVVALVVGTAGAVAAGLVNGFIVPGALARLEGSGPGAAGAVDAVYGLGRSAGSTCARVGVLGLSCTAVTWSLCLIAMKGWRRAGGVVGLACGLAPVALHAGEHLSMNVGGYSLFVGVHALWVCIAGLAVAQGWRVAEPVAEA